VRGLVADSRENEDTTSDVQDVVPTVEGDD
jgi:hypothetical protein